MQASKPRIGVAETTKRTSPVTSRANRTSKLTGSDSDSSSSSYPTIRAPADKSPTERRLPKVVKTESQKRQSSKVTELECQFVQLQEDLKKTRDQLNSSELNKKRAQQEAEETKKKLVFMSNKLEDSQNQLEELSVAEETRLKELRKISHERDRAWQSELEAIQQQHSVDNAILASATNEIQRLKLQLEMALQSEATHTQKFKEEHSELELLKKDQSEALLTIESLKVQLKDSEKAETEAKEMYMDVKRQLEIAHNTIATLFSDSSKLMDSFSIVANELKESRSRVNLLEDVVRKFQENQTSPRAMFSGSFAHPESICYVSTVSEVEQLTSELETTMIKYYQEQIENIVKVQSAHETMIKMRKDFNMREFTLEKQLNDIQAHAIILKANLFDKELELKAASNMTEKLEAEIKSRKVEHAESELSLELSQTVAEISKLKADLHSKDTKLQRIIDENEKLKLELIAKESANQKAYELAISELKSTRDAEKDALMKLNSATATAEETIEKAATLSEQLDSERTTKSEMETELKRLRIQADQWRKAAEAAAAVLSTVKNYNPEINKANFLESSNHNSIADKLMNSPLSDDLDDESVRKKRNNMLKIITGMWKKEYHK